ncbi:hypothetical protein XF30_23280 [Bradyrhizobium sp. SUTN9-2]|nr:hypothetical protein XF30_23280 [Bradyrhizobium sp. SUTN9-2]
MGVWVGLTAWNGPQQHDVCFSAQQESRMAKVDEELIRVRAHQLWELAGKPEGRQDEFWREAERELSNDAGANAEESSKTFTE